MEDMIRGEVVRDLLGLGNLGDDEEAVLNADDEAMMIAVNNIMDDFGEEEPEEQLNIGVDINRWREADGEAFSNHFRMSKETFQRLIVAVGQELERGNNLDWGKRRPLDISLMMTLWILATQDTFRSTALKFGVSKSVVFYHYVEIISALTAIAGHYIAWPDALEREHIARQFEERTGYIGCVGAIDGVNLYCTAPVHQPQRYVNRHHTHSILAQVVCDHRKLYRDVYVGEPGSVGDIQMFRRSPLSGNLYRRPDMLSEGQHLVGDQAYPLSDKMQIPYPRINADERQRNHNFILSGCRSIVERSFALLKEKFQRLRRLRSYSLQIGTMHMMSCFVLHNFIILEGQTLRENNDDDPLPDDLPPIDDNVVEESRQLGSVKREYISLVLWNQRGEPQEE